MKSCCLFWICVQCKESFDMLSKITLDYTNHSIQIEWQDCSYYIPQSSSLLLCVWSWQALWMTIYRSNYFILQVYFYILTRHQQNMYFSTIFYAPFCFSACNIYCFQCLLFGSWQNHHLLRIVWSCTGIFESNKYLKLLADHSRNTNR